MLGASPGNPALREQWRMRGNDRTVMADLSKNDIPAFNRGFQKLLTQGTSTRKDAERRQTVNA